MKFRLLCALLALPLFAQLTPTCTTPTATVSWPPDATHPRIYVRIYPGGKEIPNYVDQYAAGLRYALPASPGTATFANMTAGPWQAYLVQDTPYYQSATVPFACAVPPPPPTTLLLDVGPFQYMLPPTHSTDACVPVSWSFDANWFYLCVDAGKPNNQGKWLRWAIQNNW